MVQRFGTPSLLCWTGPYDNDAVKNARTTTTTMHSPLPDSSALEAGILEDARPSRLSRVQDNVRNLLRTSVFGSVKSSPTTPTHPPPPTAARDFATPQTYPHAQPEVVPSPTHQRAQPQGVPSPTHHIHHTHQPEVLPSPASTTTTHYSSSLRDGNDLPQTQTTYQQTVPNMSHQSAMFNSRAVAALNHPDLSDPSLETLSAQKMQRRRRHGWSRSSRGRNGRGKKRAQKMAGSRICLCLMAALLLAALVASYISIATTQANLSTTFHILFVLGICLAVIVFAHSVIRLFFVGKRSSSSAPLFIAVSRQGDQRHHRHHHGHRGPQQQRSVPTLTGEPDYVPTRPIPVHLSSDDIREDPIVAQPTAGAERPPQGDWDKDANADLPNPPPAYGRWRESVRADPNLLHWQAVPSPATPTTPVLPSPTYEEAMAASEAQHESPPSYMTRESPARLREMREARAGIARSQVVEPEMVEARGAGVGVGLAM